MKRALLLIVLVALLAVVAVVVRPLGLLDVDTDGRLRPPTVDASVSGGEIPKVQVEAAKVDVGTRSTTIKVPQVRLGEREVQVKLPTIKVTKVGEKQPDDAR